MLMDQKKTALLVAGGVIRTDKGEWVIGFAKFIGLRTIEMVEAWSLQIGLQIAISLQIGLQTLNRLYPCLCLHASYFVLLLSYRDIKTLFLCLI